MAGIRSRTGAVRTALAMALIGVAGACVGCRAGGPPSTVASSSLMSGNSTQRSVSAACVNGWHLAAFPAMPPGTRQVVLLDAAAASSTDVWAVGERWTLVPPSPEARPYPLVLHWDGRSWTVSPVANPGARTGSLWSIATVSPNDAWAAGGFAAYGRTRDQGLLEHWDGARWSVAPLPPLGGEPHGSRSIVAVAADPARGLWALGQSSPAVDGESVVRNLLLRGGDAAWKPTAAPPNRAHGGWSALMDVDVAASGAWAVGGRASGFGEISGFDGPVVLRWKGRSWSAVRGPAGAFPLTRVAVGRDGVVWAIRRPFLAEDRFSQSVGGGPGRMDVVARSGRSWHTSLLVPRGTLNDIAAGVPGVWVGGSRHGDPLIERRAGGTWRVEGRPAPDAVSSVSALSIAPDGSVTAMGATGDTPRDRVALWTRCP
ncbi:MAG TPA: hypothetical protein VGH10_09590 [Actinomycetota bacterium]